MEVTTAGVKKVIYNLQPNKVCGPDQLLPRVLKELAVIADHPRKIFQVSLDTSTVPSQCRLPMSHQFSRRMVGAVQLTTGLYPSPSV